MVKKRRILIIDDEIDMLETCERILRHLGHQCVALNDSTRASELIMKIQPDIILTDLVMPKYDGFKVLQTALEILPDVLVIIITGYATVESAVKAIKEGAFDYLAKPFSVEQLSVTIGRALKQLDLQEENQILRSQLEEKFDFANMIGAGGGLQKVVETIGKVAASEANILIRGASGTGKELVARSIHANSRRRNGPFVAVDCASLPENLLESELFGHEKGAFTGANASKEGLLELADGGTLFLDEIGEMPLALQAKLLRALEQQSFRHVGGTREISVDLRILAATNRDLEEAIAERQFRSDLFYRLNVITIQLPSLRERQQDIPALVSHFLGYFARRMEKPVKTVSPRAMECLTRYSWPGNVRELRNAIERAVTVCEGKVIMPCDLPEQLVREKCFAGSSLPDTSMPFHKAKARWIEIFEVKYLEELLKRHRGNISEVAREAGIDRKTVHRLLKKHRIRDEFQE